MTTHSEPDLRTMLCLAALTYRRYTDWTPGTLHDERLHSVVDSGLATLPQLTGQWQLAWGPESYRLPLSLFDDAMMYVVRDAKNVNRFVVAVRGTNPVSFFDWVFGDIWVSFPVPWPYGHSDGAAISMSTALGLTVLQNLRSLPSGGPLEPLWRRVDAIATTAGGIATAIADAARHLVEPVIAAIEALRPHIVPPPLPPTFANDDVLIAWMKKVWEAGAPWRQEGGKLFRSMTKGAQAELFNLLESAAKLQYAHDTGHDLLTLFRAACELGKIEITVTGHSKGGALAPAVALWLAETLPEACATVRCVAFAGPSPGNRAFADRFQTRLGGRFDRVVNELDIVPRAWEPETLRSIVDLYSPRPKCPEALALLVQSIAEDVASLGYAHLSGRLTKLTPQVSALQKSFAGQMIHQHLDGYFEALDLPLTANDFFNPF